MAAAGERLHLLYELNRGLTTFTDLTGLLRYVARRAREVFQAEGCALLLLDRERHEFYFPVVSETDEASETRLATLRFPADRGIAGWVLAHDQATLVSDATRDPRFFSGIDQQTNMTTRALLCAPLRTRSGNIGVIELVNPAADSLTADALEFLETLAGDVAVACEKALLYESLRGEVDGLRRACRTAGFGLIGVGILFVLGALLGHLAWALPLRELPTRPGMLMGVAGMAVGALLLAVARGWLVAKRPLVSG
jgi:GAF domain-containing protein